MSVISVGEIYGARSGSIDLQWRHTYRRAFRVFTSSQYDGALAVRSAIPVSLGNTYMMVDGTGAQTEFDNFAFAQKIDASIDPACNDDLQWIVAVDYGPYDPTLFPENPLDHPLKITFAGNRFESTLQEDINGNAVCNSAGDYFDPPPTRDDSRPTIRIVRNEQTYNPQYAVLWKDTVNLDLFFGYAPGYVKMSLPTGELEYSPVCGFYFVVTYEFEVNPDGWDKQILDQGLRILSGSSGQVQATDDNGDPVTSPVLLDGTGHALTTGGSPVFLKFKGYNEASFGSLGLDPSTAPGQ